MSAAWLLADWLDQRFVSAATGLATLILATGIGWLLGLQAARRDRWAAAGAAIGAAVLGTLLGSFVLAAYSASIWATSIPDAILLTVGGGFLGLVFVAGPVLLVAIPLGAWWVLLVQAVTRVLIRQPLETARVPTTEPGRRTPLRRKPFSRRRSARPA